MTEMFWLAFYRDTVLEFSQNATFNFYKEVYTLLETEMN